MSACLVFATSAAAQSCRQALVLALDVSGSVNQEEYAQQIQGLATALNAPEVRALILLGADAPVSLAVFEWSSQNHQYVIQPWTDLTNGQALDAAIARIGRHRPVRAGLKTALGTALLFAENLFDARPQCWTKTIDVSGDGKNNIGPSPAIIYDRPAFDTITVNALVVGDPATASGATLGIKPESLRDYYRTEVIHGPTAFTMIANGYADYARAMELKLIKELQPAALSWLR